MIKLTTRSHFSNIFCILSFNSFGLGLATLLDCFGYNIDFYGTGFGPVLVVPSLLDCQSLCIMTPTCEIFEYYVPASQCVLKKGIPASSIVGASGKKNLSRNLTIFDFGLNSRQCIKSRFLVSGLISGPALCPFFQGILQTWSHLISQQLYSTECVTDYE